VRGSSIERERWSSLCGVGGGVELVGVDAGEEGGDFGGGELELGVGGEPFALSTYTHRAEGVGAAAVGPTGFTQFYKDFYKEVVRSSFAVAATAGAKASWPADPPSAVWRAARRRFATPPCRRRANRSVAPRREREDVTGRAAEDSA
jgi:hypothetical protein